jgi:aspartate aminotransferase
MRGTDRSADGSLAAGRIAAASRRPASLGSTPAGAIALSMGEPDAGTPARIVDAAVEALHKGRTRYTNLTGAPELRAALAEQLQRQSGRDVATEQIVVTHGGSAGLAASVLALIDPGDRVLIPEPTYSLYADHVAMAGGEAVWVPNLPTGGLDLDALAAEVPRAKMVVICNPGNPTGRVFAEADLERLAQILEGSPDTYLLADEAYSDIVFEGVTFRSALTLPGIAAKVVLAGTFSKSYAMTGWRIGYIAAAPAVAAKINLVHRTINGSINTFVQDAAVVALQTPREALDELALRYQRRRDIVVEALSGVKGLSFLRPQGAFYAFVGVDSPLSSDEMAARYAEGGVIVRSGSEFGPSGEGSVRLSFATDTESLREGLSRLIRVTTSLTR